MGWTEIVIQVTRDQAEALSDALMESGALSVSVEDADEGTVAEQPLFGEPGMEPTEAAWDHSRVVALTDEDDDGMAGLLDRDRVAQPVIVGNGRSHEFTVMRAGAEHDGNANENSDHPRGAMAFDWCCACHRVPLAPSYAFIASVRAQSMMKPKLPWVPATGSTWAATP